MVDGIPLICDVVGVPFAHWVDAGDHQVQAKGGMERGEGDGNEDSCHPIIEEEENRLLVIEVKK